MVSSSQIREIASSYLSHNDADRFVIEFARLSYNINKNGHAEAIELANKIESRLADMRAGLISKSVFLVMLRDIAMPSLSVNRCAILISQFDDQVNQVAVVEKAFPAESFGTLPEVVFGSASLVQS